jgi:broad specificity phosphatase PhoE
MAYSPSFSISGMFATDAASRIGNPILYIVRHAQNDDDANDRIRGLKDQPLNATGEKQLEALRDFFSDRMVLGVYTDDLSRTRATAMAIAQACNCGVETDLGLRSWDVGSKLEGRSMAAHKLEIQDLKTHPDKVPVGGQSWSAFESEATGAIERAVRRGMEASAPVVIVTHGSLVQIFFQKYGDWPEHANYDRTPLDQAGVAALYLTREGHELRTLRGAKESPDE